MPLIHVFIALVIALWLAGCTTATAPNRYEIGSTQSGPGESAVAKLQRESRDALESGDASQAIALLQRAIRIEPRNAQSWHYLAQAYRQNGDFRRCTEMLERSESYRDPGDGLERANLLLREQCRQG